jgi:hypothetical protein
MYFTRLFEQIMEEHQIRQMGVQEHQHTIEKTLVMYTIGTLKLQLTFNFPLFSSIVITCIIKFMSWHPMIIVLETILFHIQC